MTGGAVLEARIEHVVGGGLGDHARGSAAETARAVMAFEAQRVDDGPTQEFAVHRTVRIMAGFAAFDADDGMFIDEGAALVLVAFDAGLFGAGGLVHHAGSHAGAPCGGEGSMRVVAIGALDDAFIDAMFDRHVELRAHGGVALVAEVLLDFGEKESGGR